MNFSWSCSLLVFLPVVLLSHGVGYAQSSACALASNNPLVLANLCSEATGGKSLPRAEVAVPRASAQPLTLTVEQINKLVLDDPPAIRFGDALVFEANRGDFILEVLLSNGREIVTQPLNQRESDNPSVAWRKGRIRLDYPSSVSQRIVGMKVTSLHAGGMPLMFRGIKVDRQGRFILELEKSQPAQSPAAPEPPTSYPPDPRVVTVSATSPSLGTGPRTGYLAPRLPALSIRPMMFQSSDSGDPNHYKYNGKELDAETGLYYYGARYYSPGLGRYTSPDWAAKATTVPYANFGNPQSLNLYTYGKNNPTSIGDVDGHCPGDDCKNVKVEVTVTDPAKIVKNEKQPGGDYATGVRANVQYTITEKAKPLSSTAVSENNTATRTLNGEQRPGKMDQQNSSTNSQGQVNDTFGLLAHSDTPLSAQDNTDFVSVLSNNNVTLTGTQTLTFQDQAGTTCSCTVDRTLTNENKDGTNNGSTYTFTTSQPSAVKPVDQPKEKKPQ